MQNITTLACHCDPGAFRVNEMEPRSYFIPFESGTECAQEREQSAFFFGLNGEWKFLYKPSLYDMEDFYAPGYDCVGFETVCVPETWQTHGADQAQYQTSPYTFLFDPPRVPEKNPCAAYVKDFPFAPHDGKKYELHFEGYEGNGSGQASAL